MWQRYNFADLRVIAHYLGNLMLVFALGMMVPFVTGLAMGEFTSASHYLLASGISLVLGVLLMMVKVTPPRLTRKQALAVTGFAWMILSLVGSIPLYLSGHFASPLDAVFEGLSALTTTGCSLVQDLNHFAVCDNMWRFTMQFLGGQGIIVIALSLGIMSSSGGTLYSSEAHSEHIIPSVMQSSRFIIRFSIAITGLATIILTVLCLFCGMAPIRAFFNGLWLAIASYNTGGMTGMSTGIIYYHSGVIEFVLMAFILIGSINFTLHNEIIKGNIEQFFRDIEVRMLAGWLSVAVFFFVLILSLSGMYDDLPTLLRRSVFTIVAAFSSTGFQTISSNQLTTVVSSGAILIIVFCMIMGGSSGSTTGGMKAFRVGILFKELSAYIKETLAPSSSRQVVTYYHLGRRALSNDVVRANLAVSLLFVFAFFITTIATIACGYDAVAGLFESVSMASNIGMSSGIIQPGMPDFLKFVYMFDMWAGRLEYVTLVALLISVLVSLKPRRRNR